MILWFYNFAFFYCCYFLFLFIIQFLQYIPIQRSEPTVRMYLRESWSLVKYEQMCVCVFVCLFFAISIFLCVAEVVVNSCKTNPLTWAPDDGFPWFVLYFSDVGDGIFSAMLLLVGFCLVFSLQLWVWVNSTGFKTSIVIFSPSLADISIIKYFSCLFITLCLPEYGASSGLWSRRYVEDFNSFGMKYFWVVCNCLPERRIVFHSCI